MGWGNVLKQGFRSVADDIATSQMGQRISQQYLDDAAKLVSSQVPTISADDAASIMAQAQDDAARWYANYTTNVGKVPDDMNSMLYKVGRGAAHTGNVVKQYGPPVAMNAAFAAPMFLPYLMQPSPQGGQQYYE